MKVQEANGTGVLPRGVVYVTSLLSAGIFGACSGSGGPSCGEGTMLEDSECVLVEENDRNGEGASGGAGAGSRNGESGGSGAGNDGNSAGAVNSASSPECQSPTFRGSSMVLRSTGDDHHFCIDTTQVSEQQFDEFLATNPDPVEQATTCLENMDFEYSCMRGPNYPVRCIQWCDAVAYCDWAGKRLCQILEPSLRASVPPFSRSEWQSACSAEYTRNYAYGNEYDPEKCDSGAEIDDATCLDEEMEVYGMSNEISEWVGPCEFTVTGWWCYAVAGAMRDSSTAESCSFVEPWSKESALDNVGFRCCADAAL